MPRQPPRAAASLRVRLRKAAARSIAPSLNVLTFVSSNYLHWLGHLHHNVLALQLQDAALEVCVADEPSWDASRRLKLNVIDVRDTRGCGQCAFLNSEQRAHPPGEYGDEAESHGSGAYTYLVHAKSVCIHLHTTQHVERRDAGVLLFVDADVTLYSDPRPFLPATADLGLMTDIGPRLSAECRAGDKACRGTTVVQCGRPIANKSAAKDFYNSGFFMMRCVQRTSRGPGARRVCRRLEAQNTEYQVTVAQVFACDGRPVD